MTIFYKQEKETSRANLSVHAGGILYAVRAVVSGLSLCLFAVFDRFRGTEVNAPHAVGTALAPDGLSRRQGDIPERADPLAPAAALK